MKLVIVHANWIWEFHFPSSNYLMPRNDIELDETSESLLRNAFLDLV